MTSFCTARKMCPLVNVTRFAPNLNGNGKNVMCDIQPTEYEKRVYHRS